MIVKAMTVDEMNFQEEVEDAKAVRRGGGGGAAAKGKKVTAEPVIAATSPRRTSRPSRT